MRVGATFVRRRNKGTRFAVDIAAIDRRAESHQSPRGAAGEGLHGLVAMRADDNPTAVISRGINL